MTAYSFTLIDAKSPWNAGDQYVVRAYFDVSTTSGGSGLANADTITATGIIPGNGVKIYDVMVVHPELDTNATPTGTFNVGDGTSASRFISGAPMGVTGVTTSGFQLRTGINIITTTTSGVVSSGAGYIYTGTSTANIVVTVGAAVATAATSGILHLLVTYRCVGNS
jgi:hypothetical protein